MSTDTPLTDAMLQKVTHGQHTDYDKDMSLIEFARNLERTLATKELAETKLRAALLRMEQRLADNMDDRETVHALHAMVREALSTPITTEALDSYVEGKVKEARAEGYMQGLEYYGTDVKPIAYMANFYRPYIFEGKAPVPLAVEVSLVNLNWPNQIPLYAAPPQPPQPTEQPK